MSKSLIIGKAVSKDEHKDKEVDYLDLSAPKLKETDADEKPQATLKQKIVDIERALEAKNQTSRKQELSRQHKHY